MTFLRSLRAIKYLRSYFAFHIPNPRVDPTDFQSVPATEDLIINDHPYLIIDGCNQLTEWLMA